MNPFLICALASLVIVIILIYVQVNFWNNHWGPANDSLEWPGKLAIIFFGFMVMHLCIYSESICKVPQEVNTPLYAGYNADKIQGNFYLGIGSIEQTEYVYYWVNSNGIKTKHSRPMSKSSFIEDGGNYMQEIYMTCSEGLAWTGRRALDKVYFHVPEGSIVQMYSFK